MPELPEVEVVRRGLTTIFKDEPILEKIELKRKDLRDPIPLKKLNTLIGESLIGVERRAKYLILKTPKGAMISHLGMTGTWRVSPPGDERLHDHIYLHFSGGLRLAYRDPRRFGCFDFWNMKDPHPRLASLGVEPLTEDFNAEALRAKLKSKSIALKVALMDQKVVVGVGNIYASEALFASGIKPSLKASSLSLLRAEKLVAEIKKILSRSIESGGSSISDFAQATGESGYFQNSFCVYDREGKDCVVCGRKIKAAVMGGRSTYWCGQCQK
jgi:formamidopyrimidine-DNA glycosylase